jgi:hypothetical protein
MGWPVRSEEMLSHKAWISFRISVLLGDQTPDQAATGGFPYPRATATPGSS